MSRRRDPGPPDDLVAFTGDQYDRVRGSLALFTGDRELAEELAQEVFVKVCQHWERVRDMDAPGAWAHRVGINLAISRARRRRSERRAVERVGAQVAATEAALPGADAALADEALRDAVAALPVDERAALVLRFHADLPVAEVAAALGVPEGTVKTRTRRALAALREARVLTDAEAAGGDGQDPGAGSARTAGGTGAAGDVTAAAAAPGPSGGDALVAGPPGVPPPPTGLGRGAPEGARGPAVPADDGEGRP